MKRLRRIVWNGLGAASVLLCMAICVLWWRCYIVGYSVSYMEQAQKIVPVEIEGVRAWRQIGWSKTNDLIFVRGRIAYAHSYADGRVKKWELTTFAPDTNIPANRWGFDRQEEYLVMPFWSVFLISATFTMVFIMWWIHKSQAVNVKA